MAVKGALAPSVRTPLSVKDVRVATRRIVLRESYGLPVPWDDKSGLEGLMAVADADELCRQLLASPSGWGSSTRHMEAVELLDKVHDTGELPTVLVALLLCSCRRWDRVTTRLIAAIGTSALLNDAELDELGESLLSHELVIFYPLTWVSPQWLNVDLSDGTSPYPHGRRRHARSAPSNVRAAAAALGGTARAAG